jgi:hypothetical protein
LSQLLVHFKEKLRGFLQGFFVLINTLAMKITILFIPAASKFFPTMKTLIFIVDNIKN